MVNGFFFPKMILSPTDVYHYILRDFNNIEQMPRSFKEQTGEIDTYATYATRVKIPQEYVGKTLAVHVPFQYSAYKLYADRVEIASNGEVGRSELTHRSEMAPRLGYFVPMTDEVLFTMQISSYNSIRGGFDNTSFIGDANIVAQKFNTNVIWTLFVNGCICIMGIFMLMFAWFRRQEKVFYILGFFCICFSLRSFYAYPFYYMLTMLDFSWVWGTRLEYMFTEASVLTFLLFFAEWYKKYFSRKLLYVISLSLFALITITLFTQPIVFQKLYFNTFYLMFPLAVYMISIIIKSYRTNSDRDLVNIFGIIIVLIGFINDYATAQGWMNSVSLSLPAVGIYVVIHAFLMSRRYAEKVFETETLNESLTLLNMTLDEKVNHRTAQLQKANELLEKQALCDGLTGIYNRHRFNEYIRQQFQQSIENNTPLSIIIFDLDEFKKYNDYYGHISGDQLLKLVVQLVNKVLPSNSLFARYGGEEFVIVLPYTGLEDAYKLAESIRIAIAYKEIPHKMRECGIATISVGVAAMSASSTFKSEVELIDAADQQLYRSKHAGRNVTYTAELVHHTDMQH